MAFFCAIPVPKIVLVPLFCPFVILAIVCGLEKISRIDCANGIDLLSRNLLIREWIRISSRMQMKDRKRIERLEEET